MVRGYRVRWSPDPDAGLVAHDEDDDDTRYVLVTGEMRNFKGCRLDHRRRGEAARP
jgi:hypothetical protein